MAFETVLMRYGKPKKDELTILRSLLVSTWSFSITVPICTAVTCLSSTMRLSLATMGGRRGGGGIGRSSDASQIFSWWSSLLLMVVAHLLPFGVDPVLSDELLHQGDQDRVLLDLGKAKLKV